MNDDINEIGEIEFHDLIVKIYYDEYLDDNGCANAIWRMRNPDSCYQGILYKNITTGEITYPEDAVIPEQTTEDREIIPIAVIIGSNILTNENIDNIRIHLENGYKRRNNIT